MANFDFIATDHQGRNFRGTLTGPTEQSVYGRLQKLGYVVLSITRREKKESAPLLIMPVTSDDIVIFAKLFSAVIGAGLPVNDALAALEEQIEKYTLKKAIRLVRLDVESGASLSEAFSRHPKVFPNIFISMVSSGEMAGKIGESLGRLTEYLERDQEIRRSVRSAFMYPKIIMLIATCAIVYLMRFVIPTFVHVYEQLNMYNRLTWPTVALISASKFFVEYGLYLLIAVIGGISLFYWFKNSPSTRKSYDRMVMCLPVFGKLTARLAIARTVRALGSMLECGVPILDSFETSKLVLNNKVIEDDIDRVMENVELGGNISTPLRMSRHFPPVVIYMVSAGEHSGRLPNLLVKCSDAMEKELEHLLKRLLFVLEIGLIVLVAAVIAFIAIAVYMPIFEIITSSPK